MHACSPRLEGSEPLATQQPGSPDHFAPMIATECDIRSVSCADPDLLSVETRRMLCQLVAAKLTWYGLLTGRVRTMPTSNASVDTTDRSTGFRGLARRHPITLYLALVFGLGCSLMFGVLLLPQGIIPAGTAQGASNLEVAASAILVFLALFPAALIVTVLEGGRPAIVALFRRMVHWRIGAGWWAIVLLALPLTTIALALLLGDALRSPTLDSLGKEALGFAIGFLGFNYLEEASWSGFMQTRLQRRYNVYAAAALTAIPFAGIHMPLQVINGVTSPVRILIAFALLSVLAIVVRSLFGLVKRGSGES